MSFHKTASLQSYRIPVERLFTSASVSHLVHALSVTAVGRKHHKYRLQQTINMHIPPPPPPPSTTIAEVTQVAMQLSYKYIPPPPHTSTTTTTDHHHTVQVAHHYRRSPCSANWPPPQSSTMQCKLPTTTQCKLLECMWSMCASGWKENTTSASWLQRVVPPLVQRVFVRMAEGKTQPASDRYHLCK